MQFGIKLNKDDGTIISIIKNPENTISSKLIDGIISLTKEEVDILNNTNTNIKDFLKTLSKRYKITIQSILKRKENEK